MNNFQRITASREALAAFLGTIPAIETPWDDAFHRIYCSSCSAADCTPAEKVEIEYLFDFYKRLWEKEKDAFLAAYIQKHRIFAIRADVFAALSQEFERSSRILAEEWAQTSALAKIAVISESND